MKKSSYVLQGRISNGDWWTIRALTSINEIMYTRKRYAGRVDRRIVYLDDCPWYKFPKAS